MGNSQEILNRLFDLSPDLLAIFSHEGKWVRVNQAWETTLGYSREELLGKKATDLIHPDDIRDSIERPTQELRRTDRLTHFRNRYLHKDGSYRWLEWTAARTGEEGHLIAIARDVTQSVREETLLRKTQIMTKSGGWETDIFTGKVTWMPNLYEIHEVDPKTFEPTRENIAQLFSPEVQARMDAGFASAIETGWIYDEVLPSRTGTGKTKWLRIVGEAEYVNGRPVRIFGTTQDIDQIKKTEDRLNQYQKLESIGRLAGGIAHDFNNILAVIAGHAAMLAMEMKGDPRTEKIDKILSSIERASGLTQQLLAYSRQQAIHLKPTDLAQAVRECGELMTRLIGGSVQMEIVTPETPAMILGDSSQMTQILMNLGINARDAIRTDDQRTSGRIRFLLEDTTVSPACPWNQRGLNPGKYWHLSVIDDGCGMDPSTAGRAFEPFFTTKEFGKGTGLGLATVYGIVQQLRGYALIDSELLQGTTIHVFFPKLERLDVETKVHDVAIADDIFLAFQP